MDVYLGLGSNIGDRAKNLSQAINFLKKNNISIIKISPIVETPALLLEGSPYNWNKPFLNLVLLCKINKDPESFLTDIKNIEKKLGRKDNKRWSPREIDIDILSWGNKLLSTKKLTIPHPKLHERNFVLTPLLSLKPRLKLPGINKNIIQLSEDIDNHIPLWMGILNITPDSFSDGGIYKNIFDIEKKIDDMIENSVNIIDIGGESTRPNAKEVSPEKEWERIYPVLQLLLNKKKNNLFFPLLSIDTYHPETAIKAINIGVDLINDVSGLTNIEMQNIARNSNQDWVAMHNIGIPANKNKIITGKTTKEIKKNLEDWLTQNIKNWEKAGIDLNRIIFDPGIGFGKDANQSYKILSTIGSFKKYGLRILVGHSRKSFLNDLIGSGNRDSSTLGISMKLLQQKVDILRVHNIGLHTEAYKAWQRIY